jgi:hypothetical protein
MEYLNDVARLIIKQIDHNRECGKEDGYTMEDIAGIIERRVLGREKEAVLKPVIQYSREPFEGWTERYVIKLEVDGFSGRHIFITIYSNSSSYPELVKYLDARISRRVLSFKLDSRSTKAKDESDARIIDEVISKLSVVSGT